MEKRWVEQIQPDANQVEKLSKELNVNHVLSSLLIQRGISSFQEAKSFFRPKLEQLHDPFLMKDMDLAVNRLSDAIAANERILVYGDYDVDGTTSVALVFGFLKAFTQNIDYYIPDRYKEGYGLSSQGIEFAAASNVSLIISLDCGIKAFSVASLAKKFQIDLIICDHHEPGESLPAATAVLDPKRRDCSYPYKELSGCGVGFKLLTGFCQQNTIEINRLYEYLDLVAVSIASDIVPITGENRILAFYGLRKLNKCAQPGLRALRDIAGLKGDLNISDIVFYIGPRINAAGRLTHARESVKLLIASHEKETEDFASSLHKINATRKEYDHQITEEALEIIRDVTSKKYPHSTVLYNKSWHKGVIGIVASRCIEHYYRPTIILTASKGHVTGSARSIIGFDIYKAIDQCSDLLEQFGGHKHAAGLTMKPENIDAFRDKFEEVVSSSIDTNLLVPQLTIDMAINFEMISFKTLSVLNQMAPFGPGNPRPVFSAEVITQSEPVVIKEEHLKLYIGQKGIRKKYPAIGFGLGKYASGIRPNETFKIAFTVEENEYNGNKSIQLILKDIKLRDHSSIGENGAKG
jgi:single-stranded-DNA-specific exonuclease